MGKLQGKRVLLFSPKFFNYHELIKCAIEAEGAEVLLIDERNNPTAFEKILLRKAHFLMSPKINTYYKDLTKELHNFNPDYMLFISPEAVTAVALENLRFTFPQCRLILYMWDSVANKNVKNILQYFDYKYSFDQQDCRKYGMIFRPLFYAKEFERDTSNCNYKYDLSFIGTVHSDRAKILRQIKTYCDKNNISYYFYLYIPGKLLLFLRLFFNKDLRSWERKYIHTV